MPGSGSEKRQRQISLKVRVNAEEAALIRDQADRAGISVASLFRFAVLGETPVRASRTPPLDRKQVAQLIAALGTVAAAIRELSPEETEQLEAALRDLAELRAAALVALGRAP